MHKISHFNFKIEENKKITFNFPVVYLWFTISISRKTWEIFRINYEIFWYEIQQQEASIAQLGERKTEDLEALCSIHSRGIPFVRHGSTVLYSCAGGSRDRRWWCQLLYFWVCSNFCMNHLATCELDDERWNNEHTIQPTQTYTLNTIPTHRVSLRMNESSMKFSVLLLLSLCSFSVSIYTSSLYCELWILNGILHAVFFVSISTINHQLSLITEQLMYYNQSNHFHTTFIIMAYKYK